VGFVLSKVTRGFFVAPLVAAALATLWAIVRTDFPPDFSSRQGYEDVVTYAMVIALLCYVAELLFGSPLLTLFRRRRWLSLWHFFVLGALCAFSLAVPLALIMYPARGVSFGAGLVGTLKVFVPLGIINAAAFWWLAMRRGGT
jgi:hypothetical protein